MPDNVIILPESIEHPDYVDFAERLLELGDVPVTLYCSGSGGSTRDGLAIVDLIEAHGNVTGVLIGAAMSVHGMIWAACQTRIITPRAMLGVHKAGFTTQERGVDTMTARLMIKRLAFYEEHLARILSAASNKNKEWWRDVIERAGSDEFEVFGADELIALDMAQSGAALVRQNGANKAQAI
jgi:ATP-dependent protease ClpP protease subunit